jgi:hypothetical protein
VNVTDLGVGPDGLPQGLDGAYRAPTEGQIRASSTGPLTVEISDRKATQSPDTVRWIRAAKVRRHGR